MRILFFILIFLYTLNATSILNYSFISNDESFEIVLNFDKSYNGQIRKQTLNNKILLLFEELDIKADYSKNIDSSIIKSISMSNMQNNSFALEITSPLSLDINISKNISNNSLKIKIAAKNSFSFTELGAQKDTNIDNKYISVIIVLIVLCIILFIIKKRISYKKMLLQDEQDMQELLQTKHNSSNSIKKEIKNEFDNLMSNFDIKTEQAVQILFEKPLDDKNKVMLLKHQENKYLILVGSSNVLLDSFGEDNISSKKDFESFFEENKQKLSAYILKRQNSLENYKNTLLED